MQQRTLSSSLCAATMAFLFTLGTTGVWAAATEKVLYSFGSIFPDGDNPEGGLVFDSSGNLYGTTIGGGAEGDGAVYELTPSSSGWIETVLYSFCPKRINCTDGWAPIGSLTVDKVGNLYGTTYFGGNNGCGNGGCGVVFELSPGANGWTETVLYTFSGGNDGAKPIAGLVFDAAGNLYGTTVYGGSGNCASGFAPGCGVVFELTKNPNGGWTESVLHSFEGGTDGDSPSARVTLNAAGEVYGTTAGNAPTDPGTVFRLRRTKTGWTETVLYRFKGTTDGNSPEADVVLDKSGSVYGTTRYGGSGKCSAFGYNGCGTVFQVQRSKTRWTEHILHSFRGGANDGKDPAAGVVFDSKGDLYGTTAEGGTTGNCGSNGCGTVFKLSPVTGGKWSESLLHRFDDSAGDGAYPLGDIVLDCTGNVYSSTQYGGANNWGTVFQVAP